MIFYYDVFVLRRCRNGDASFFSVCVQWGHECVWDMLNREVVGVLTDHKYYVKLQLVRQVEHLYISVAGIDQVA